MMKRSFLNIDPSFLGVLISSIFVTSCLLFPYPAQARFRSVTAYDADPISWGLDRIDQRELPLSDTFDAIGTGGGVNVYVLDTGIDGSHGEFGSRVVPGYDVLSGEDADVDYDGHGTAIAGIIGGNSLGIARNVTLVPVRVWDGIGEANSWDIVEGINWAIDAFNPELPSVLNLSLADSSTGIWTPSVRSAISRATSAGLLVVTSAGDNAEDACSLLPSMWRAIHVGGSDIDDNLAATSNFGECVDVIAPGHSISTAAPGGGYTMISSSDAAAAHVTAVAALMLSLDPTVPPEYLETELIFQATSDQLNVPAGTPNRLLHVAEFSHPTLALAGSPDLYTQIDYSSFDGALPVVGKWISARSSYNGFPRPTVHREWYKCKRSDLLSDIAPLPSDCTYVGTGSNYIPQSKDSGSYLRVLEDVFNSLGSIEIVSEASRKVGAAPSFKSAPTIEGTSRVGTILRGIVPRITGGSPKTFFYSWYVCNRPLSASSGSNFAHCARLIGERTLVLRLNSQDYSKYYRFGVLVESEYGRSEYYSATSSSVR